MNYVFKVFVGKFLSLYIDNFEDSQFLIYQGALNLHKVHLKLQTINKLLKENLAPFIIIKADIDMLKIDIPWSSLNSQPIKTSITGLNVILEYQPITQLDSIIQDLHNKDNKLSIQNEMRKHKEIDEQLWRRFVKRLLLNLSFEIKDVQVEVLIKQQYRLQLVCQEFQTYCQDNLRINPEDVDQFHRLLKLDTFLIKFIRFKDNEGSYSNQQLLALDQGNAFVERNKDSIHVNFEINNFNLILEKDIIEIASEMAQHHAATNAYIKDQLADQPEMENFILQDIIKVRKGIKVFAFANNIFIQVQQLCFFISQLELVSKQFASQQWLKLGYKSVEVKHTGSTLIRFSTNEEEFSMWPEYFEIIEEKSKQVNIEIITNQDRFKQIDQKVHVQLHNLEVALHPDALLANLPSIHALVISHLDLLSNSQPKQSSSPPYKQHKSSKPVFKKTHLKIGCSKLTLLVNLRNAQIYRLLYQSHSQLELYHKGPKLKALELTYKQLQFEIFDDLNHLVLMLLGLQIVLTKEKAFSCQVRALQLQVRVHQQTLLTLAQLQKLQINPPPAPRAHPTNHQLPQSAKLNKSGMLRCKIQLARVLLDFGEIVSGNSYSPLAQVKLKRIVSDFVYPEAGKAMQHIQFASSASVWMSHPITKSFYKITNTFEIQFNWEDHPMLQQEQDQKESRLSPFQNAKILNSLQLLSSVEITLNQLTITTLIHLNRILQQQQVCPQIINRTKRKIRFVLSPKSEAQHSITLLPETSTIFPRLYDQMKSQSEIQKAEVQLGIEIDESLIFWSKPYPLTLNQQYFNKFTIIDEIDQQEYDLFVKSKDQNLLITQYEKLQIEKDLQNLQLNDPVFDNQTPYVIGFKIGNQDQMQIDQFSRILFPTKLTDNSSVIITLYCLNMQEIRVTFKDLTQKDALLSFNFVKIDQNFFNVLLSLEVQKDFKCQYVTKITLKPFISIINLLPWSFSVGQSEYVNLPISVDATMNNQLININEAKIELFYQSLVQNRKNASNPSQQIYVNNEQTQAYFLQFLNDGKCALEINHSNHLIMIFRNNALINNQLCFIVCRNVYQAQIKYLLVVNRTTFSFVLMKNKSRIHIHPRSENCFEHNVAKGEKYRLFISDASFDLLQLLDQDYLEQHGLKVNKLQVNNIHFLEIVKNHQKNAGQEFKISLPKVSININIADRSTIKLNFDLNIRFFSDQHLDLLVQQLTMHSDQTQLIRFTDLFLILELSQSGNLNLIVVNNFLFKIKDVKVALHQLLISQLKTLVQLLRLDPTMVEDRASESAVNQRVIRDSLNHQTIFVLNLIVDPICLELDIQTNFLNMQNQISLPQLKLKTKKYKTSQFKQELISFYLAYLITKIPTIQLLVQNIPNPLQMLTSKKFDNEPLKFPQLLISNYASKKPCTGDLVVLLKEFYDPAQKQKGYLKIGKSCMTVQLKSSNRGQSICLNQISELSLSGHQLVLIMKDQQHLVLQSQKIKEVADTIKELLI